MAPAPEAVYLPALDKCLKGELPILSWKSAFVGLCDLFDGNECLTLERFLRDDAVRNIVTEPLSGFPQPSAKTRSDFETRTAAINVLPSNNGQYDIEQLKADAQWLSKEGDVDEVSALRVVILEWQQRAEAQLDYVESAKEKPIGYSDHETGPENRPQSAESGDGRPFHSDEQRRSRLLNILGSEQTSSLKISEALIGIAQPPDLQPTGHATTEGPSVPAWLHQYSKSIWTAQRGEDAQGTGQVMFLRCVDALKDVIYKLSDSSRWPKAILADEYLTIAYPKSLVVRMIAILRLALLHGSSTTTLHSADVVSAWYDLMDQRMFLSDIQLDHPDTNDLMIIVHCLVSLVSTSVLQISSALEYIQTTYSQDDIIAYPALTRAPYLEDEDCVRLLTSSLLGATAQSVRHASPAVLAWSIIAQNLRGIASNSGSDSQRQLDDGSSDSESPQARKPALRDNRAKQTKPEILVEMILDTTPGEDSIALMGNGAVNELRVFEVLSSVAEALLLAFGAELDLHTVICGKMVFFDLLRDGLPLVQYGPDVVQSALSIISYDDKASSPWPSEPANTLLDDGDIMGPRFMEQVISRYPYELSPFLVCLAALAKSAASVDTDGSRISQLLDNMGTFTCTLPAHFEAYDLVKEDEMMNCIRLTQDLPFFSAPKAKGAASKRSASGNPRHAVPAGTVGIILNDSRPFVVCWQYQHSALEYLGTLLSTRTSNGSIQDTASSSPLDQETAADTIRLITSLAESLSSTGNMDEARHHLGRLSYGLDRNDDIIRVVLEVFEQELETQVDHPGTDRSIGLLTECAKFATAILRVYPERIWSFLARSRLLAVNENFNALANIVGATEVPLAQYRFLHVCTILFESLVEDAVKRAVSRKGVASKAVTRFEDRIPTPGSTPEKIMTGVILTFERTFLDVLQSQMTWRFIDPTEKTAINIRITKTLTSILDYTYSLDDSTLAANKLTGFLSPASEALLDLLLADTGQTVATQAILNTITDAVSGLESAPTVEAANRQITQITGVLSLCSTMLKVALLLGRQGGQLLTQLYEATPLLAKLFALHPSLKVFIADVLTSMVQVAKQNGTEPPSLLGHMSSDATKAFLSTLSQLDQPLQRLETEVKIWDMLSAVVSNKQQWLAICILTGSTPRDRLRSKADKTVPSRTYPLLTVALNALSTIGTLQPRRAISMLTFVSLSQKHWPWATNEIGRHKTFITNVIDWLSGIAPNARPADAEAATRSANENQMAAFVADILATYMHHARQTGSSSIATTVAPKLQYMRDNAVAVGGYNHSLHKNLARNFSQKYPNCTLDNIKRTVLHPADFGREYYYDTKLASKMLDYDPSWKRGNKQGFIEEVSRANINLSVVESQIALLKSWKGLAVELSRYATDDAQIQRDLAKVIDSCLKANIEASIPALLFENVAQIRAELAFVLLQQLVNIQSKEIEVRDLTHIAWTAIRASGQNFDLASSPRDLDYYRLLLRILFLSLQPQIYNASPSTTFGRSAISSPPSNSVTKTPSLGPVLVEVLQKVVATNFRSLCSSVHADPQSIVPSDFVLLTALLQTILRIPDTAALHAQIGILVSDASLIRYATSLYTWSDALADPSTSDPIYGEIGILFILSLSSIGILAEQMAIEGVLSHLSAANISSYLRKSSGKGPFDSPARMHDIWTRGLLPLCLNLLEAVGAPIAAEIAGFLNSFPQQLTRSVADLANTQPTVRNPHASSLTLGLATETHELALLARVLDRLRELGPAAGLPSEGYQTLALVGYEKAAVKEEVESALRSRRALRERIVPVGEREAGWARAQPAQKGGEAESRLEEKVVAELQAALECLGA